MLGIDQPASPASHVENERLSKRQKLVQSDQELPFVKERQMVTATIATTSTTNVEVAAPSVNSTSIHQSKDLGKDAPHEEVSHWV